MTTTNQSHHERNRFSVSTARFTRTRRGHAENFLRLVGLLVLVGSGATALGCSVDVGDAPLSDATPGAAEEAIGESTEALKAGGGRLGFTCDVNHCSCSKEIEGDCDRMLINCVGDMTDFYRCLDGWLTADCSCNARIVAPPPRRFGTIAPIGGATLAR